MTNPPLPRQYWPLLVYFLSLRMLFSLGAFPNSDEAYYWLWGQHPALSYFDHPPFHAWVQGGFTAGLGTSRLVLRLPTFITTGGLLWLYGRICQDLYPQHHRTAFWLTVLLLLSSPLFFLFTAMAWNDHWLILLGAAASYCLVQCLVGLQQDDRAVAVRWLYGSGVLLGWAGLCKYLVLFLGIGFLVAIATHPPSRSLFHNPHLYGAILTAIAIMAPVFVWNAQHQFHSFQFYLGRSVQAESTTTHWFGPIGFLGLSLLIFGPVHSGVIIKTLGQSAQGLPARCYRRVAIVLFAVSTLLLAALSLKAAVLYYWNLLAYPLLFPLMAGIFLPPEAQQTPLPEPPAEPLPQSGHTLRASKTPLRLRYRRYFHGALSWGAIAATLLVIHYTVLPWSALVSANGDEDSRMLYGWRAIADWVNTTTASFPNPPLLLTTDYRSAAALAFQLNTPNVWALSGRIDQTDFWWKAKEMQGQNALILSDRWHPLCPVHLSFFDHTDPPETLTIKRFGVPIKDYTLVRGYGLRNTNAIADPFASTYPLAFTTDGETCTPEAPASQGKIKSGQYLNSDS